MKPMYKSNNIWQSLNPNEINNYLDTMISVDFSDGAGYEYSQVLNHQDSLEKRFQFVQA